VVEHEADALLAAAESDLDLPPAQRLRGVLDARSSGGGVTGYTQPFTNAKWSSNRSTGSR
jgi:hypothetical protein